MGIDFHNNTIIYKRHSPAHNSIRSRSEFPLTRSDLLFLKSIGLKVKKQQWARWKN